MLPAQAIQQARQDVGRYRGNHPQAHLPGKRFAGCIAQSDHILDIKQDGLGPFDHVAAEASEDDLAIISLHQRGAQRFLQLENTGAESGLGHVTGLGGIAEVTVLGNGTEIFELLESWLAGQGESPSMNILTNHTESIISIKYSQNIRYTDQSTGTKLLMPDCFLDRHVRPRDGLSVN